jgi:hypothetical protein
MPIRMEDDPTGPQDQSNDDNNYPQRPGNRGGGVGGGIFTLLPLLLRLFKGKGLLFLLVIGGGLYLFSRTGCNIGGGSILNNISNLATGGFLDPKQFEKASIYEPLTEDNTRNPLPEAANLQQYAPPVGNQGNRVPA